MLQSSVDDVGRRWNAASNLMPASALKTGKEPQRVYAGDLGGTSKRLSDQK